MTSLLAAGPYASISLPLPSRYKRNDQISVTQTLSSVRYSAPTSNSSNNSNNSNNCLNLPDYGHSTTFQPSVDKFSFGIQNNAHFNTDPEMYALRNMLSAQNTLAPSIITTNTTNTTTTTTNTNTNTNTNANSSSNSNSNNNPSSSVAIQRPLSNGCVTVKRPSVNSRMAYVEALVDTNALLIESIWYSSSPSTKTAAVVPLRTFIQEVLKRSRAIYSTLQTSLFYLFRSRPAIMESLQKRVNGQEGCMRSCNHSVRCESAYIRCGRRMFLASLIVASKFVQDKTYRNSAWAKIAGLPVAEINAAERIFLELIDYRLYIAQPTFEQWHHMLHMHVAAKTQNQPTTLHDLSCLPFSDTNSAVQKKPSTTNTTTHNTNNTIITTSASQRSGWSVTQSPTSFAPRQPSPLQQQVHSNQPYTSQPQQHTRKSTADSCECHSRTSRKRGIMDIQTHDENLNSNSNIISKRWTVLSTLSSPLSCSPHSIGSNSSPSTQPHPPVLSLPSSSNSSPAHTPLQISPIRIAHPPHDYDYNHHHLNLNLNLNNHHIRSFAVYTPPMGTKRDYPDDNLSGYAVSSVRETKRKQCRVRY
ncbi:hypothetical protein F4703DRAFT_1559380 [Phycomyces blakesleeanus]